MNIGTQNLLQQPQNNRLGIYNNNNKNYKPSFKGGPLDGLINQTLTTIETNQMVNAALVDVGAMVAPRTYVDTKERNGFAGTETFIREIMGTFCVCLSSGLFAKGIARLYNHFYNPETKINPDIWATKDSLALLNHSWEKGGNDVHKYVSNIVSNMSGIDGHDKVEMANVKWNNVPWIDSPKWAKYNWKDEKFKGIEAQLKDKDSIVKTLSEVIQDKNIDRKDAKQILNIISYRITNALGVGESVDVNFDGKKINASMENIIRDTYDLGKDIFKNDGVNIKSALEKLTKMSKVKTIGGLAGSSFLALITQYVNRQITKKRTGKDAFVGDVNYEKMQGGEAVKPKKENKARLLGLKLLASAGMIGMSASVMHVNILKPAAFLKKLEFTGAVTSGNAMKTIYAAQLTGRFMASRDENELRETTTRDYLGFLNWLVFGGFVSKGVAKMLDRGQHNMFNFDKEGTGVKHWLNDIREKSHAEIAAKGEKAAKNFIWKKNIAQASGLAYSLVALGILLPMLNIFVTKHKQKQEQQAALKQ